MPEDPQRQTHEFRAPEVVKVSVADTGNARMAPLDRWGTSFVWWAGAWSLAVGFILVVYFLANNPAFPEVSGKSGDEARVMLANHQAEVDALWKSLAQIFDLLVTKTALPVITLMLGYLFGKRQS